VRPGGRLIYATCSLSRFENEAVVSDFLAANPAFKADPMPQNFGFTPDAATGGLTILPARHNTDGFFVAALRRA
jgi:16S rRNA (cytosine967-C5)-methyltransferase